MYPKKITDSTVYLVYPTLSFPEKACFMNEERRVKTAKLMRA